MDHLSKPMAPSGDIIRQLRILKAAQKEVKLFNAYKGIPIAYAATILTCQANAVIFRLNQYQAVCIQTQHETFIEGEGFREKVHARAAGVNFLDQTAILTGFTYVQGDIGSRLFVRVEPKNSAPVEFSIKGSQLKGQLVDISLEGVGIHTAAGFFGPNYFTVNTPLQLVLQLPSTGSPVKLTGVIVNQSKTSNSYRLGIKTAPDSQARQVVSQYIAQRQAAVLRELHMLYDMFEKLEGK